MHISLLLKFVVMLSAMCQGPAVYWDLSCVEPEPGYAQRFFHYFTATEIEKVCPTPADLTWRIGNEVFCNLLWVVLTLLMGFAQWLGLRAKERCSAMISMIHEWRSRPSRCRHCGTTPCQVNRRSFLKPSGSGKRENANFAERSNAMMLFNYGLELSVILTKELPMDDLYWERRLCQHFKEEHMLMFPLCVQRQINYCYPVPH